MPRRQLIFSVALLLTITLIGLSLPSTSALIGSLKITQPPSMPAPPGVHVKAGVASLNWAGYAVTAAAGSVTDVKGSWNQPTVDCTQTPNSYVAFWVGIDGYSSSTVEQIGTLAQCNSGVATYYAWYEFYPKSMVVISSLTVKAGDHILAEVSHVGGNIGFIASITDSSTGKFFSTTDKVPNAERSSAEWIVEAPSSGGRILPLTDFGTAYYGYDYTFISNTCYATVDGVTSPISTFSTSVPGASLQQITMVTSTGAIKAQPNPVSADGTSFTVQWVSQGP